MEDDDLVVKIVTDLPPSESYSGDRDRHAKAVSEMVPRFSLVPSTSSLGGFALPTEYLKYDHSSGYRGGMYDADDLDEAFVVGVNAGALRDEASLAAWLTQANEGITPSCSNSSQLSTAVKGASFSVTPVKKKSSFLTLSWLEAAIEALERASFIGSALATAQRSREAALAQKASAYTQAYSALSAIETLRKHWGASGEALSREVAASLSGRAFSTQPLPAAPAGPIGGSRVPLTGTQHPPAPLSSRKRPRVENSSPREKDGSSSGSSLPLSSGGGGGVGEVTRLAVLNSLSTAMSNFFVSPEEASDILGGVRATQTPPPSASGGEVSEALPPAFVYRLVHQYWVWRRVQESKDCNREKGGDLGMADTAGSSGGGGGEGGGCAFSAGMGENVGELRSALPPLSIRSSSRPSSPSTATASTTSTAYSRATTAAMSSERSYTSAADFGSVSGHISVDSISRGHLLRTFQTLGAGDIPPELDLPSLALVVGIDPSLIPTPSTLAALGGIFDRSAAGNGGLGAGVMAGVAEEEEEEELGGATTTGAAGTKAGFVAWKRAAWLGKIKSLMIGHDLRAHQRLRALRTAIERVRVILDLVRKREKLRRSMVSSGFTGALSVFPELIELQEASFYRRSHKLSTAAADRGDASAAATATAATTNPSKSGLPMNKGDSARVKRQCAIAASIAIAASSSSSSSSSTLSHPTTTRKSRSGPPASELFPSLSSSTLTSLSPSALPGDSSPQFQALVSLALAEKQQLLERLPTERQRNLSVTPIPLSLPKVLAALPPTSASHSSWPATLTAAGGSFSPMGRPPLCSSASQKFVECNKPDRKSASAAKSSARTPSMEEAAATGAANNNNNNNNCSII